MAQEIIYSVNQVLDNGNVDQLEEFDDIEKAEEHFSDLLKKDGSKPIDMDSYTIRIDKVILDEDGQIEDVVEVKGQVLYKRGTINRALRGEPIYYGYECFWNAEKQELEYDFYFFGEKTHEGILESQLNDWYYKIDIPENTQF